MEVRVKQESQDEALVPLCGKSNNNSHSANGSINPPGPMQKVPSLSDLSDPESSLGKSVSIKLLYSLFLSHAPVLRYTYASNSVNPSSSFFFFPPPSDKTVFSKKEKITKRDLFPVGWSWSNYSGSAAAAVKQQVVSPPLDVRGSYCYFSFERGEGRENPKMRKWLVEGQLNQSTESPSSSTLLFLDATLFVGFLMMKLFFEAFLVNPFINRWRSKYRHLFLF